MEIILFLFFTILSFCILYLIIQSAIDGSKTAEEIRQIRMILQKQYGESLKQNIPSDNNYEAMDVPYDTCPACGATVKLDNNTCPSCGLNLNGENG
ncbi:hypothetical protein Cpap_0924 [Ruminiclostridium papyrosolvens DSM 2782]|uniref:Putative zinc-ribbon domain-containing protein n=1 Tax=Ruminiclostridium papyrosolvens DSM 2782 TaxID=588581 RepID=F1TH71_9FIRM|nr:zinc ribbon domain-containing protein [Ruminiclostridium papyrosolvens]EGD46311.1 hypothetical protein Cpap_0924 [Ruminiclostridium papyrosolvens DSM 2782]WES32969.1 zinc ribbon domain-containing protein [Ruminiclostridium papyrosolvens DSM 2782]